MNAEIITSGTELLLGTTVDTNSIYIARALHEVGVNLYYKTSVGDNAERLAGVVRDGLARSDSVIITGGLGPTVDDVTREAVARATGRDLQLRPDCLAAIEEVFARWQRPMGENNRRQAYLPAGSTPIMNPVGTAPGFIVQTGRSTVIALPGVPREMEHLVKNDVLPYLRQRLGEEQQFVIKARTLRTVALGESWIDEQIDDLMRAANPTVGLAAHSGIVNIRITARAPEMVEAERMIDRMESAVRARLRPLDIFGQDADTLEAVTADALFQAAVKLGVVESNTGGQIAQGLSAAAGGHAVVQAVHVVSGPDSLDRLLAQSGGCPSAHGWASGEAALAAATTLRDPGQDAWALAVLGDMTARDDVYGEETGQTWAALVTPKASQVQHYPYGGQGELARQWVKLRIWDLLRRAALEKLGAPDGKGRR